jgi:glycosyltransferase involved in cell wall biosynthesis
MLQALTELGSIEICILSPDPANSEARAATSAALPAARVMAIPVVLRPRRRAGFLWPYTSWSDAWGKLDFLAIRNAIQTAVGRNDFDVVWGFNTPCVPLLHGWGASIRIIDLPELFHVMHQQQGSLGSRRHGLVGQILGLRWKLDAASHAQRWRGVYRRACKNASHIVVCSEADRNSLRCRERVMVVPNGYEIPEQPVGKGNVVGRARTLLFQGSNYYPNSEGAVFFARDVFPLIRRSIPDAQFRVVGNHNEWVLGLSDCKGVVIVGPVDNIEDELAKADAVVVPLRIGTGPRLKILEAWAHGVPVVSTTVGAAGLPASSGENLLVADSASELAEACIRVLTDPNLRMRLAEAGRQTVVSGLSWADIQARFLAMIRAQLEG